MPSPHLLITGATGGIGRALMAKVSAWMPQPCLTLAARDEARLAALTGSVADLATCAGDLTSEAGVDALDARLADRPPLTGVAHLVGSLLLKPTHRMTFSEWRGTIQANLDSAFLVLRLAARRATPEQPVSVVLMSSVAAGLGLANHEAIAAAKAGIEGLVRAAAATYAGRGLRVNAVAPSLTVTPLTAALVSSEAIRTAVASQHAIPRLGQPEDQGAAIAWLLSSESSWVTGQVLAVDGGLSTVRVR